MAHQTNLYFVAHTLPDFENLDLFVEAHTADQAIKLWQKWAAEYLAYPPDALHSKPNSIFLVPNLSNAERVMLWGRDILAVEQ